MELVLVVLALIGGILIGIAVGWRVGFRAGQKAGYRDELSAWRQRDPSDSATGI